MFNRDEIVERVGAENWEMVESEFGGMSHGDILATLNDMYPQDDNTELAYSILVEIE